MTDTEINCAISEAFQLENADFCDDLNAVHESENFIQDWQSYVTELDKIIFGGIGTMPRWKAIKMLFNATARQRAEAILKTLGKWKD